MLISDNDYIIATYEGIKPRLILVANSKHRKGYLEQGANPEARETTITYASDSVIAVLGPKPKFGNAFGVKIEPYLRSIESKRWGTLHLFRELEPNEWKALKLGLKKAYISIKKAIPDVKVFPFDIEIRNKKGKYAGMYVPARNKGEDKQRDKLILCPEVLSDFQFNKYVILHEFAHAVWNRQVPDFIKTKWLRLYSKRLILTKVKKDQLESLRTSISEYNGNISDYLKEMASEDDVVLIKEVMKYLHTKRHLDKHDIHLLIANDQDLLVQNWPSLAELTETKHDVSEYAGKDVRELFAESVAFHLTGKTLPKDITKALSYTFARLV